MRRVVLQAVLVLTVAMVAAPASAQSASRLAGTWKLNIDRSKWDPGPPPGQDTGNTTTFAMVGGRLRMTVENVFGPGMKTSNVTTVTFDEKDQPVEGMAEPVTRAFKWIDANTWQWVQKVDGAVSATNTFVISRDGQVLTGTSTRNKNVMVLEKQK